MILLESKLLSVHESKPSCSESSNLPKEGMDSPHAFVSQTGSRVSFDRGDFQHSYDIIGTSTVYSAAASSSWEHLRPSTPSTPLSFYSMDQSDSEEVFLS